MCVLTDTVFHYCRKKPDIIRPAFERIESNQCPLTLLMQETQQQCHLIYAQISQLLLYVVRNYERYTHIIGITINIQNYVYIGTFLQHFPSVFSVTYGLILRPVCTNTFRSCCIEVEQKSCVSSYPNIPQEFGIQSKCNSLKLN